MLNTRIGKLAVSGMQFAKEAALDAGYATLDAAEWVVKKGGQAVNYVGQKATDLVNLIGDTRMVKGAVGLAKDFASWVTSTEIYKSATEIATYIYRKMSNFCTALSESYHYYNQCRTVARRLVIEKPGLVDEHSILKTFHGISQQETKKAENNQKSDNVSFQKIENFN